MDKFRFDIQSGEFGYEVSQIEVGDVTFVKLKLHTDKPTVPHNVSLRFLFPAIDVYSVWSPNSASLRVLAPFGFVTNVESGIAIGAPVATLISKSGKNRITVALDDVNVASNIKLCVEEESKCVRFNVLLFTSIMHPITDYEVTLRLDRSDIRYESALINVEKWWHSYIPECAVPDAARQPVLSTWYSYHQGLDADELLLQCKLAVKYGMKTLLVDDGWQTCDNNRGYAFCGDWSVEQSKIKDMKAFVDNVHKLGMKVMLWYSVPFVGVHSKNFAKFKGKFLYSSGDNSFSALDPRFPECRRFTVDLYKNAVCAWGLDGLKLDFIDSFRLSETSSKEYDKMDYISLEEAINALLNEISSTLKAINPDFLIEFRQKYTGPVMRQTANMLRVTDCPCSAEQNKFGTVDIRLLSGKTAVHSDMVEWHEQDTPESIAMQIIATMYSVPQISVKLDKIPQEHKDVLKFYMDFWCKNRELLLDGQLTALNPESFYSLIKSELNRKAVITAYSCRYIDISELDSGSVINATGDDVLALKATIGAVCTVYDCMGNKVESNRFASSSEIVKVPLCGMINFKK